MFGRNKNSQVLSTLYVNNDYQNDIQNKIFQK